MSYPKRNKINASTGDYSNAVKNETLACDDADIYTAMVLGGCHSLVSIEGSGIVGDPIEIAGIMEWAGNMKQRRRP